MSILYEERTSDLPCTATIARIQTPSDGFSLLPADGHWYFYITRLNGNMTFTIGGPITKAIALPHIEGADSIGVRLKVGTYMPHLPIKTLVNGVVTLPDASSRSFWLNGSAWQFPDHENVDVFLTRLVRSGVLVHDPLISATLQGKAHDLSLRSIQRRFLAVTGLTHSTIRQIDRAQQAAALLRQGVSILDTAFETGYFDQAHLTHSVKQYVGMTPAQLERP